MKTSYFTINSKCSQNFYTTIKCNRKKIEFIVCLIETKKKKLFRSTKNYLKNFFTTNNFNNKKVVTLKLHLKGLN